MFTSTKTREIQKDIEAALQAVADKHGFTLPPVDLRRARHDAFARLMKMDFYPKSAAGGDPFQAIRMQMSTGTKKVVGLLATGMSANNIVNTTNSKGDELIEYIPSRPKYPFVYRSAKGTRWKVSAAQARARFN